MAELDRRKFVRRAAAAGAVAWATPQIVSARTPAPSGTPDPGSGGGAVNPCAGVTFTETWEGEGCGLGIGSLTNWDITSGDVDVIGNGDSSSCGYVTTGSQNKVLDLDGNGNGSTIETKTTFPAGTYDVTIYLGGSQRGTTNTTHVNFGTLDEGFQFDSGDAIAAIHREATLAAPGKFRITSPASGAVGLLLGDVSIGCRP